MKKTVRHFFFLHLSHYLSLSVFSQKNGVIIKIRLCLTGFYYHSIIAITFMLARRDSIKRRTLYLESFFLGVREDHKSKVFVDDSGVRGNFFDF